MMPRLICLVAMIACAGCVGNQRLSQVEYPRPVLTSTKSDRTTLDQAPTPRTRLQPVSCQGERYDDHLIEENPNQPVLRQLIPTI